MCYCNFNKQTHNLNYLSKHHETIMNTESYKYISKFNTEKISYIAHNEHINITLILINT